MSIIGKILDNLPCLLSCNNKDNDTSEKIDICKERCERWNSLSATFEALFKPEIDYIRAINFLYSTSIQKGTSSFNVRNCFILCNNDSLTPVCNRPCERLIDSIRELSFLRNELTFDQCKKYLIWILWGMGRSASEILQLIYLTNKNRYSFPYYLHIITPDKLKDRIRSNSVFRLCQFNIWMVNTRFILGLLLLILLLINYLIGIIKLPYIQLIIVSIVLLIGNIIFSIRLFKHHREEDRLKNQDCNVCTIPFIESQIIFDFICVSFITFFSGGIFSPATLLFLPHIIFSSILFIPHTKNINILLVVFLLTTILLLHTYGLIPSNTIIHLFQPIQSNYLTLLIWLILSAYILIIGLFSTRLSIEIKNWFSEYMQLYSLVEEWSEITKSVNKRYEQIDNFRQKMIYVASHDLKSPLSTIEGYVNLFLDGYCGEIPRKQAELLGKISSKIKDMRELINDILDAAHIEKEGLIKELEIIDPTPIVHQAYRENKIVAEKFNIEIRLDSPDQIPPIISNKLRFCQIIQNLISNAIKFTPENGTITIKVIPRDTDILFIVSDTGMGIPKEDLPFIFEEFYRSGHIKRRVKGSGLGLYIVKRIVDAQGGNIWVESEVGKGTQFYFSFKRPKN